MGDWGKSELFAYTAGGIPIEPVRSGIGHGLFSRRSLKTASLFSSDPAMKLKSPPKLPLSLEAANSAKELGILSALAGQSFSPLHGFARPLPSCLATLKSPALEVAFLRVP